MFKGDQILVRTTITKTLTWTTEVWAKCNKDLLLKTWVVKVCLINNHRTDLQEECLPVEWVCHQDKDHLIWVLQVIIISVTYLEKILSSKVVLQRDNDDHKCLHTIIPNYISI